MVCAWPWIRRVLFTIPPESAHEFVLARLERWGRSQYGRALLGRMVGGSVPEAPRRVMGLRFPNPVGLAAGMDKDARAVLAWSVLGFGFVEVGTVTPRPQPGNPPPRLFRLPEDGALLNRMGFNNEGAEAVARRLERLVDRPVPVGVNIGKNKDTPVSRAHEDYARAAERLAPLADYLVVNVSSPNTPGLRDLQAVTSLRPILESALEGAVRGSRRRVPLLVKLSPDLADEDVLAAAELALDVGLAGVVAVNTTVRREGLRSVTEGLGPGGVSGRPLATRARDVLSLLAPVLRGRAALISVGGVDSPREASARLRAGADLVQLFTGLVYEGPSLPSRIARALTDADGTVPSAVSSREEVA